MKLSELIGHDGQVDARFAARDITGIAADSRKVKPGYLFVAVPGTKADGLSYVAQAVAAGAAAVLAERKPENLPEDVAHTVTTNVRRALALAAARFHPRQPATIAAVTGTSGKTSVAAFTRQIWAALGHEAASIGTIGLVTPREEIYGSLTTPDPIELARTLDRLAEDGITHLAMEASSHGLDQYRLEGVRVTVGGFTNLSRDHMDYHASEDAYLAAKLILFERIVADGGAAVLSADGAHAERVVAAAGKRGLRILTVGRNGAGVRLADVEIDGFSQTLRLEHDGKPHRVRLPLVGAFQVENALVAAGMAIATGSDPAKVFAALEGLEGAKGRLELVGQRNGAPIFVDYAHKPDALSKALDALRPYAKRKLVVVFGAGGDRDQGKRPLMGAIAAEKADAVIVTDDNPRSEKPEAIRAAIMATARGASEIGDRGEAIRHAVAALQPGDVLLVAGKGHERGQIVGDRVLDFSDHEAIAAALPLWSLDAMAVAMRAARSGNLPPAVPGLSIDTRTIRPGEAFFAIRGENRDGHDFVEAALDAGAGLAVVARDKAGAMPKGAPLLIVEDVLAGLSDLAQASRARTQAKIVAVTGSVGKTGTKEALRLELGKQGETHASAASYNNHWGVPLSLALMPQSAKFGVFEIGMNHAGEITPLTKLVRPHVAIVTTIAPVHLEFFGTLEAIADAKAEIFLGLEPGGAAVLNADNAQYAHLRKAAQAAGVKRIVAFGERADCDARLVKVSLQAEASTVQAHILGADVTYKLGAPGRHVVDNSLAVLAAARLLGADLALAALALADLKAPAGRGERVTLELPGGAALLIDESYNANPTSMRAALALLGQAPTNNKGRRIAVLGDMLELGPEGAALHAGLADAVTANAVDLVFCCGALMKSLWDALPSERRGGYGETSLEIEPHVLAAIQPHDAVMIKGSLGSRMGPIVRALKDRFAVNRSAEHLRSLNFDLEVVPPPPQFLPQEFGPQFILSEEGLVDVAPPKALDDRGNNVGFLRVLHPEVRNLATQLAKALSAGNKPYPELLGHVQAYATLVDQRLEDVSLSLVYFRGLRLQNATQATRAMIAARELPPFSTEIEENLATLFQLHGSFVLSTADGLALTASADRYGRSRDEEQRLRDLMRLLLHALDDRPDLANVQVRELVREATTEIRHADNPERNAVITTSIARNLTVVVTAGAIIGALPVVGNLAAGALGLVVGGGAALVGVDGLKKSKSYALVSALLAANLDRLSSEGLAREIAKRAQTLNRHVAFTLKIERILRQFRLDPEHEKWISAALSWLKERVQRHGRSGS